MACIVDAPSCVTVRTVNEFSGMMREALTSGEAITLDLAALEELDLSFVQVVVAARRAGEQAGMAFALARPAAANVTALLERAGFLTDPSPEDLQFWFHGARPQ